MQKHSRMTLRRLTAYRKEIEAQLYKAEEKIPIEHIKAPGRITYGEAVQGDFQPVQPGIQLRPVWSTHWFRVKIKIPEGWQEEEVHLIWDSSSEACVWYDGQPLQGLTGSNSGWQEAPVRYVFPIDEKIRGQLYIEAAVNGFFGIPWNKPTEVERIGWLREAKLAVFDRLVWDLLWDYTIIADMAAELPQDSPRAGQALYTANLMINTIDWSNRDQLHQARRIAAEFLNQGNGASQHQLSVIGHAHIDTAWLWPLAESKRKCVRSFSTAVDLMDRYPDYRFVCSQAQQLHWIKTEYPGLYERIREKVQTGQFIPAGATWVEPDTNVPSGEALVRQFLYGQQFFKEEFGEISRVFWEPDVFGYSGALPQIMKKCGVDYFLTQKLSWNEFNKPDRHTFYWEGLDGSQVLAHFPPVDTYNSMANVREILYNVKNYKDHERSNESYLLFGFGDGGGGPTAEILEQLKRMEDVDGLPKVSMRSPEEFFNRLESDLKSPTVWRGELYFEKHRGTYTTQAKTKAYNRYCEQALHTLEFLAAVNAANRQADYPYTLLKNLWQQVLTNQFHDILPGSSIEIVHQEAEAAYQQILNEVQEKIEEQISALTFKSENHTVINPLGFRRQSVVELPEAASAGQENADGSKLGLLDMQPYSICALDEVLVKDTRRVSIFEVDDGFMMENDYVLVKINKKGKTTSFFEKNSQREVIKPGATGNQFVLYEDKPCDYDAWDVDVFYLEKPNLVNTDCIFTITETGPLRVTLTMERNLGKNSRLKQTVSLTAVSPRLDFDTKVNWLENEQFLRVLFPLNLRSDFATYEVQFGCLQRPTHFNTSYDLARFEVPAQRWADLSEPDFGVSFLNNNKYGYACHGSVLSLSLLRATNFPDPTADRGEQSFRYALYPHALSPQLSAVWSEAAIFNQDCLIFSGTPQQSLISFAKADAPNIVLDTIKAAENGNGLILRFYEASGCRTQAVLQLPTGVKQAWLCDLLENNLQAVTYENGLIRYGFKPFEILTIRVEFFIGSL